MSTTQGETRNWLELPLEVTISILSRLDVIEIVRSAERVCTQWRKICKDPLTWRCIDMSHSGKVRDLDYDLDEVCLHAVDRSCGQLLQISLQNFVTDELLIQIAQRSCQLKGLRLVSCDDITDKGLTEVASKLPCLEDLEISYCSISKGALETVGLSCPHLKSLKFNMQGCRRFHWVSDDEALAIAQTMPKLRHLQLFGNKLTNDGLQAILKGCRYLESLDLRHCFNVSLEGNLEKTCTDRIKNLRCPFDSIHDYEFHEELHDIGSSDGDYPSRMSDIDLMSDDYDNYFEFSGASDLSDYENSEYEYDEYLIFSNGLSMTKTPEPGLGTR